jgi:cyanophycin synthetase
MPGSEGGAEVKVRDTAVYVGPSLWAYFPVIRLTVDLGRLDAWPSGRLGPAFQRGLLSALPGLRSHRCSYGVPGGFVRRLTEDEGTWLGHVLEHTAIELQNIAGFHVAFGRARGVRGLPGVYDVVYEYHDREVGLAAGRLALDLLTSLLPPQLRGSGAPFEFEGSRAEFLELARDRMLGPTTAALVAAAQRRHIPWERLDDDHLIQLGHGASQRRLQGSITSRTIQIAVDTASDKALTNRLLESMGIPVPRQVRVYDTEEAVAAARGLGYPVVVKPLDGNHGRGVHPGIRGDAGVRTAFPAARSEGSGVLVEEHIAGFDYRLLVVGDRFVAGARRVPAHVVGDGEHTIAQLVASVNADPRRGEGHDAVLTRIELDAEADRMLALSGLDRGAVPAAGRIVYLRATANLSRGGTAIDVTDAVHPDNRALAVRAAGVIGLNIAGVDFLTPDIARSCRDVGAVCEVNAAPGLRMHIAPSEGMARAVAEPIIDDLVPNGETARIPIAAITGTNGKTTTAQMVAHIASKAGLYVGLATTNGVSFDGRLVVPGDATGPISARMILRDPAVQCAVLETARGGLLRAGLAFRHCSVGAVLNVTADHLGQSGIETVEDLAEVKRIVVEVATDIAVLNADDPHCRAMIPHAAARELCLVSMNADSPHVASHLEDGGRAVTLEAGDDAAIVLRSGDSAVRLVAVRDIPATHSGRIGFNVQNALFATAVAAGLGLSPDQIRAGLLTFATGPDQTPGRVNICDTHPFRVIVDYGHNPAAVRAMCEAANRLANGGRTICVIAAPGDRRDDDIRAVASAAAGSCDLYICRRDDSLRGRGPGDVPRLLREGLLAASVSPDRIHVVPEEAEAMATALRLARPGDLLLLFADDIERTWGQVKTFVPDSRSPTPAERPRRPTRRRVRPARRS